MMLGLSILGLLAIDIRLIAQYLIADPFVSNQKTDLAGHGIDDKLGQDFAAHRLDSVKSGYLALAMTAEVFASTDSRPRNGR